MLKHSTAATMVNDLHGAAGWLLNHARIFGIEHRWIDWTQTVTWFYLIVNVNEN